MSSPRIVLTIDDNPKIVLGATLPIGSGEANDLSDAGLGAHESLVASPSKLGAALQAKGIRAGSDIALVDDVPNNVVEIQSTYIGGDFNALAVAQTTDYTITLSDYYVPVDASAGPVTITLPTAVGVLGRSFTVKKKDNTGNAVILDGDGAETIDGDDNKTITTPGNSITVMSDGANWDII